MALGREGSWTCGRVGATKRDGRGAGAGQLRICFVHAGVQQVRQGKARQDRVGPGVPAGRSQRGMMKGDEEEEDRDEA